MRRLPDSTRTAATERCRIVGYRPDAFLAARERAPLRERPVWAGCEGRAYWPRLRVASSRAGFFFATRFFTGGVFFTVIGRLARRLLPLWAWPSFS